jgi:hypothetical protein
VHKSSFATVVQAGRIQLSTWQYSIEQDEITNAILPFDSLPP